MIFTLTYYYRYYVVDHLYLYFEDFYFSQQRGWFLQITTLDVKNVMLFMDNNNNTKYRTKLYKSILMQYVHVVSISLNTNHRTQPRNARQ